MARLQPQIKELAQDAEMNGFLSEFQSESDRAAAVLGSAMLDNLLSDLIKSHVASDALAKKILGVAQPLGTFSARISAAEALALISADEARDLDRAREIRNEFAHQLHGLKFTDQSIRERCKHFRCVNAVLSKSDKFATEYPRDGRSLFNLAVSLLAFHLRRRLNSAVRPQSIDAPW